MSARKHHQPQDRAPWTRADVIALLAVTGLGGAARLLRLPVPERQIFDETFYARDACFYITRRTTECGLIGEPPEVHPPLGKWLIGAGLKIFGNAPFGGRIVPALAGTLTVALLYLLGRRLLGSTLGAAAGATFLALDILHIQQSRVAALDVIAAAFAVGGVLAAVIDRDRPGERSQRGGPWGRPWRVIAGILLGAAVATKWPHLLTWVLILVLTLTWETLSRRGQTSRPFDRALRDEGPTIAVYLLVIPAVVYVASYIGRLHAESVGDWVSQFLEQQSFMYTYLQAPRPLHPYESTAWQWLVGLGPIPYLFATQAGRYIEVLAAGNPLTWIPGLVGIVASATQAILSRAAHHAGTIIGGAFAVLFGPWLLLSLLGRGHLFIYYLVPSLPFMGLGIGYLVETVPRRWRPAVAGALATATVTILVIAYPLIAAVPLSPETWEARSHYSFDICSPITDFEVDIQAKIGMACGR